MQRVRTVLVAVVAVVVVGLLARAPVDSVTPQPTPSAAPSATPSPSATPVPPTDGLPEARLLAQPVDPRTLLASDRFPPARVGIDFLTSSGPGPLLIADQLASGARVRFVDTGSDPASWRTESIDRIEDLVWLGSVDGTIAWVRDDGIVRVQIPGAITANRTLSLPPDRRPTDARLVDGRTLAVVTAPGLTEPATLTVMDLESHVSVAEVSLSDGQARQDVSHAWDLTDDTLYAVDGTVLQAVDLRTGSVRSVELPAPASRTAQGPLRSRLTVSAADGLVVVSGTDEVRLPGGRGDTVPRPYGVATLRSPGPTTLDRPLELLAHDDDATTTRAVALSGSRVLALTDRAGGSLRDATLVAVRVLPADQVVQQVRPGPALAHLLVCGADDASCTADGADPAAIVALDPGDGSVVQQRAWAAGTLAFLPDPGLLVVRQERSPGTPN